MMRFSRYLSVRLFLIIIAVIVVVFSLNTYLNIKTTTGQLTNLVYQNAYHLSDVLKRSTRYHMLLNRKEDVYQIINTAGSEPGILGIRIYNKVGYIVFSTDSAEVGTKVDMKAESCIICHKSDEPLTSESVPTQNRMRVYTSPGNGRVLGLINPIKNEPDCYTAFCHAHSPDQTILGVLDVKMSLAPVDAHVARTKSQMVILTAIMTVLISVLSGIFLYYLVRKPIKKLITGMNAIASGKLKTRINITSDDEIGELANSFNKMSDELDKARSEINEWAQTLEDRIREKTRELEKVQAQMIHMEKMVSLGKLSATVAHEINNPLFGILTYSKLISRELEGDELDENRIEMIQKYLATIQKESSRCGEIVKNLLLFAKRGGAELAPHRLHEILDHTLMLINHHCGMQHIEIVREFEAENDEIVCDDNQLEQAFIAMCMNAIEAMPEGGVLTVRTLSLDSRLEVHIADTGVGIPEDVVPRIFEPFFSTKEGQPGAGLGLSVAYGIIQRHKGEIDMETVVNKGTVFKIVLPREPEVDESDMENMIPGEDGYYEK